MIVVCTNLRHVLAYHTQTRYVTHRLVMCNFENPKTDVVGGHVIDGGWKMGGSVYVRDGIINWETT